MPTVIMNAPSEKHSPRTLLVDVREVYEEPGTHVTLHPRQFGGVEWGVSWGEEAGVF